MSIAKIVLSVFLTIFVINLILLNVRESKCSKKPLNGLIYLIASFFSLQLLNFIFSNTHPYLLDTLASPSSAITRGLLFNSNAYLRRILEPSLIIIVLSFIYLRSTIDNKISKTAFTFAIFVCCTTVHVEGILLNSAFSLHPGDLDFPSTNLLPYAWTMVFVLGSFGLTVYILNIDRLVPIKVNFTLVVFFAATIILTAVVSPNNSPDRLFKSIHYYVWFPENWKAGYGENDKGTKKQPELGEYKSDDPEIVKTHLKAISQDFDILLIDWWPNQRSLRNRAKYVLSKIPEDSTLKFAVHFETQDLSNGDLICDLSNQVIKRKLLNSIKYLAKYVLNHKNYLTINGKKVIYFYISRHIVGDTYSVFNEIKKEVKDKFNLQLFFVGDEAFYNVLSGSSKTDLKLEHKFLPNWDRIASFDAITIYNPYDPQENYGEDSVIIQRNFLAKTVELYTEYKKISELAGIPFIPTAIPGYNDISLRPSEKHLVLARDTITGNTLAELEKISEKIISNYQTGIYSITSWNEWNEGTNIEK